MSFTCPRCDMTSHHPMDEDYGYCGNCHAFTGAAQPVERKEFEIVRSASRMFEDAANTWMERALKAETTLAERGPTDPELQLWYDLRRAADELALAKWRGAHPGHDLIIPDHADLVIFLIDQLVAPRAMTVGGLTDAELDDVYERSKLDSEIIVGSEIRQLVSEIWSHRRLNRVDTTLAKRLGEMIEKNSAIKVKLADWQRAYPLDIFPEPDLVKAAELLKAGGMTLDAVSANMARHVLKGVADIINPDHADLGTFG